MAKKRIALVGASSRVRMFVKELRKGHMDRYEFAGIMDVDPGKMRGFCEMMDLNVPMFTDFDALCDAVKPDIVIVTTVDRYHAEYVCRALDRKIAVVSEKPLCISAEQCRAIRAAQKRNPGVFAATSHNVRYYAPVRKMRDLIQSGAIGRVLTCQFTEMLDRYHGTSYFRRWNSERANTGGLQFHKASHHFDELNWMMNTRAAEVTAVGDLISYGAKASPFRGKNCHTCTHDCPYRVRYEDDKDSPTYRMFYKYAIPGGYTPDLCIFRPEIDIEDFLNVTIRYENGVLCNYNLTAQANYEGQTIIFDGETGRIEFESRIYRDLKTQTDDVQDTNTLSRNKLTLCRYGHGEPESFPVDTSEGGHGGSDKLIVADLFGDHPSDTLATLEEGMQAVLVAAAINESLATHGPVQVQPLLNG